VPTHGRHFDRFLERSCRLWRLFGCYTQADDLDNSGSAFNNSRLGSSFSLGSFG